MRMVYVVHVIDRACRAAILRALAAEGLGVAADRVFSELRAAGSFVALDDLTGVAELAVEHGVGKSTISNWAARYPGDFPAPLATFAMGKLYSRSDVREWCQDRRPALSEGEGV